MMNPSTFTNLTTPNLIDPAMSNLIHNPVTSSVLKLSNTVSANPLHRSLMQNSTLPSHHHALNPIHHQEKPTSKKTAYNEKWGVKVLKAWMMDNNLNSDFEVLPIDQLDAMLTRFWTGIRKSNGDYYGRNSLFNLRAMINKHLKGKPYCVNFDIVTDERFRQSNETLG